MPASVVASGPKSSDLDSVTVLTGGITACVTPRKFHIFFLEAYNHIVAIRERTGRKSVSAEKTVFSLQSVQVYNVSDLHDSSFF